ncbi:MAG: B12-binding domain-containing protein [Phycisphaerales bacterium JB063]
MTSRPNAILDRFFTCLISGDRPGARGVMDELFEADCPADKIASNLIWPTLHNLQTMRRNDQLTALAFNYATRLLRGITDQLQLRFEQKDRRGIKCLVVCGAEESEELAGQLTADLLEADGYEVYFTGGGIANDEIVEQLGQINAQKLVIFGAIPATVPQTRQLIDRLHDIGVCPDIQIIVGGGIFNRAEGLSEEIGADLWANDPLELVEEMNNHPTQRMEPAEQRTVGRRKAQASRKTKAA